MPTAATIPTTALVSALLWRHHAAAPLPSPSPVAPARPAIGVPRRPAALFRRRISCQVAITTDASSSSSPSVAEEEAEALAKIGRRVRVKVPLKVYHVLKAPELDLEGMEGEIKQYVALWKGKRISANLPFKVEFHVAVEGQPKPVKFFAHLKEDEFEYLPSSD
ncbi:ferredoxin-thioredoxin reductase, variable chain-like [Phoenix dactylifera]|uniref:Ferredoxin-thioredoxin reductase, variable chain-like n=1 Tax=Phoenix dactylifera TaxID=42345 RepID=A0A8B7CU79_PHODC|nr:ferredoxin-thioredoxin reductase, variable chain-like [Phoenix dactylifera]